MAVRKTTVGDLSQLLRARRRELGLTQRDLGERLGIDQRTVSALEKRPGSISVNRLFAVFNALDMMVYTSNDTRDESHLQRYFPELSAQRMRRMF